MMIPTYSLYGDDADAMALEWIHCETIQARSSLHDYRIEPHRHERLFQILHLAEGSAVVEYDGTRLTLEAPFLVTMPAMSVHGYAFSPNVAGRVLTFFATRLPDILGSAGGLAEMFRRPRLIRIDDQAEHARLAGDIAAIADEFEHWRPERLSVIEARLRLVLIGIARLGDGTAEAELVSGPVASRHIARFRDLIDQNYGRHWPIETYARKIGVTAIHLNRLCRELAGDSALGLVHARLNLEAKRMLTFTGMSAKEIAFALNFSDPSYFGRFFRRMTGMSPARFRALHRGGPVAASDETDDGYKMASKTGGGRDRLSQTEDA